MCLNEIIDNFNGQMINQRVTSENIETLPDGHVIPLKNLVKTSNSFKSANACLWSTPGLQPSIKTMCYCFL